MVIKGKSRTNGVQLAGYLLDHMRNDRVEVMAINHPESGDLHKALIDMQDMTDSGQRGTKGLYHAQISPAPDYVLTREQWFESVRVLEAELGLEGQPHALVLHEDKGRIHAHVVWQRTDCEKLTLIPDSHNYAAHERAARKLERQFGHERIDGPHTGKTKDDKSFSKAEAQQGERSALLPTERKAQLTALWQQSDSGKAFTAALHEVGYVLAQGDRRGLVIVDEHGEVHSLARQINGVKTKEIEQRLDHIDKKALPGVTEALAEQMQKREKKFTALDPDQVERKREKERKSKSGPASTQGPALKRGIENPDEKEKRLRSLTRNVISLINRKIDEVTENSRLYQSAKTMVVAAKKQVVGFMRSVGFEMGEQTAQRDDQQKAIEPTRDEKPVLQPQQVEAVQDKPAEKEGHKPALDLETIERQNREKQRQSDGVDKSQPLDLEALEKKNREAQRQADGLDKDRPLDLEALEKKNREAQKRREQDQRQRQQDQDRERE